MFSLITNTLAKDKEIADRWRGFEDVAQSRHLANRVEPETIEALVAAVQGAYPRLSHRYYKLKACLLYTSVTVDGKAFRARRSFNQQFSGEHAVHGKLAEIAVAVIHTYEIHDAIAYHQR